jgi:hypothetical protein
MILAVVPVVFTRFQKTGFQGLGSMKKLNFQAILSDK